jgi:hypothetical protein
MDETKKHAELSKDIRTKRKEIKEEIMNERKV